MPRKTDYDEPIQEALDCRDALEELEHVVALINKSMLRLHARMADMADHYNLDPGLMLTNAGSKSE